MTEAMAVTNPRDLDPFQPKNFEEAQGLANWLAKSNLTPMTLRGKPNDIMIVMMAARDAGLSVYQGLQECIVIDGKVTMSARLISARAMNHPQCRVFSVTEATEQRAVVRVERNDWPEGKFQEVEFTIEQAEQAGLLRPSRSGRPTAWQSWTVDMLVARARTRAANWFFPDAMYGFQETQAMEAVVAQKKGRTLEDELPHELEYENGTREPGPPARSPAVEDAEVVESTPDPRVDEEKTASPLEQKLDEPPKRTPVEEVVKSTMEKAGFTDVETEDVTPEPEPEPKKKTKKKSRRKRCDGCTDLFDPDELTDGLCSDCHEATLKKDVEEMMPDEPEIEAQPGESWQLIEELGKKVFENPERFEDWLEKNTGHSDPKELDKDVSRRVIQAFQAAIQKRAAKGKK